MIRSSVECGGQSLQKAIPRCIVSTCWAAIITSNLFTVGWQRRQSFKLRMLQLAGIFTSVVRLLQCGEIWERNGGSPPDKNWAADYRKGTCIGYKILRYLYETAEGTRAIQPSVEGSPERVHNGFSRSENLSGQLIEIKHSHQTHMIEISCEIPCCIPKNTKNVRMVDESETWRRMVSRCSEICMTSNRS